MATKAEAPVYPQPALHEKESRWQCAVCQGYLAFSLPIDLKAMAQMLKLFSKAHDRCTPLATQPTVPARRPPVRSSPRAAPVVGGPQVSTEMGYDPNGPTAKAHARREVLLALPRVHTPAESRELARLEAQLVQAGVLTISTTF